MTSTVLVTGGTGTLGRLVVPLLREADFKVRVLSRSPRESTDDGIEFVAGDLATGEGVDAAVAGVGTIIHLAGGPKGDETLAENLVKAANATGRPHVVYISVVGADRDSFAYFTQKRAAENIIAESGLPWTTVRATQFNDLAFTVAKALAKLPVVPVPAGFRVQPIDARDVAARLVELARGEPAGLVADIAGPKIYDLKDIVRSYLKATNRHHLLLPLYLPGKGPKAFRAGVNLAPTRAVGQHTWEDFLATRTQ
jgi:uncharacterized protein YbjT (DUF2867 family)